MSCLSHSLHNRLSRRSASILAAAAASAGLSSSVFASSGTWTFTGGSNSWTNPTAWVNSFVAGLDGNPADFAVFNANLTTGNGQPNNFAINLGANLTLSSISFTDSNTQTPSGWSVLDSGGSITLNNGANVATITVNTMGPDTFHGADILTYVGIYARLFGTSGLTKTGGGMLRLGADNSNLSGTLSVNAGTLEIAALGTVSILAPMGNVGPTINMGGGVLSLRSDSVIDLGVKTLNLTADSGVNVDNFVSIIGSNGGNNGGAHAIGSVILSGAANRTLTVTGSHNASLHIGIMSTTANNQGVVINNLSPGSLTIGTFLSVGAGANGNTTLTLGGTGTTSVGGAGDIFISNSVNQGSVNLSIAYNDVHTLTIGSFNGVTGGLFVNGGAFRANASTNAGGGSITLFAGGGTLNVLAGGIPTGSLTVRVGVLNVTQTLTHSLTSTTTQLTMGGGTVSSGTVSATANLNGGTLLITSTAANIAVNTGTLASGSLNGTGATAAVQTLATLNGNIDLGSGPATIRVGPTATLLAATRLDINGTVVGTGDITKTGLGELRLLSANTLSGAMNIQGGTLTGVAQTSGSVLSSGPMTISSGALRVQGVAATASASVPTLQFSGESLDPARLVVDATSGGTTTLNVGTFLGRVAGTTGVLTVVPQAGSLNTSEVIHIDNFDPSVDPASTGFRNMLPAYIAAQTSGSNTAMDFLTKDGGSNLMVATYSASTDINTAGSDAIFQATGSTTNVVGAGTASLFALKNQGQTISGTGTLIVGDGVRAAGIILNNGASLSVSNLVLNSPEAVIWAGGTGSANITTPFKLNGNLTTAGSATLNLGGTVNLNGDRTITVGSGYTVLGGTLSNGNVTKSGPGTLSLTNTNAGYAGTLTVNNGTAEIAGVNGNLAAGTVIVNAGGQLAFNKPSALFTFSRPIQGAGTVVQNSTGGTLQLTGGTLNTFANLNISSGRVQLTTGNQLPTAVVVTNTGSAAVLDLNGRNQTIGGLNGIGSVTNGGTIPSTLTVNGGGSFGGSIQNFGANGIMALVKNDANSTLTLMAASTFTGGTQINAGTIAIPVNSAPAANRLGQSTVTMNGGAINLGTLVNLQNSINVLGGSSNTITFNGNGGETDDFAMFGSGTMNFVKQGNNTASFPGVWNTFAGTVSLADSGGTFSLNTGANVNFGSALAFWDLGTGSAAIRGTNGITINLGALVGGPNTFLAPPVAQANLSPNVNTYLIGALNLSTTFAGQIVDSVGSFSALNKVGAAVLTLTGTSPFSGDTTVTTGRLVVGPGGNLTGNSNMFINGTGTFGFAGSGTISGVRNIAVNGGVFDASGVFTTPGSVTLVGTTQDAMTGYFSGNFVHSAGTISPGGPLIAGTVTFGSTGDPGIVNLVGGTELIDIFAPGTAGQGLNDLIVVNGNLDIQPATAFRLNQIDDNRVINASDEYPILKYSGARTGSLLPIISAGFRGTFTLVDHPAASGPGGTLGIKVISFIDLPPANLTWTASQSADWDLNITSNFAEFGVGTTFFQLDNVTMDDTANTGSVNLVPTIIKPGLLTINNNTLGYRIAGPGSIGGTGSMVKSGTGVLTLVSKNKYTGGTTINGGMVTTGTISAGTVLIPGTFDGGPLGTGTVTLNNASLSISNLFFNNDVNVPTGSSGTILAQFTAGSAAFGGNLHGGGTINAISAGTINLNSVDNRDATGWFNLLPDPSVVNSTIVVRLGFLSQSALAGGNLFWNLPLTPAPRATLRGGVFDPWQLEIPLGGVQGNGTLQAQNGGDIAPKKRWVIGALGLSSTWVGAMIDNQGTPSGNNSGGAASLRKVGGGTLVMNGTALTYSGETIVDAGVLVLDGALNTGGATLNGNLQNSPLIQVNGGTFLMINNVQLSRANRVASVGDVTMGVTFAANTGGNIDFTQIYNYESGADPEDPTVVDRYQIPMGMTLSGNGGTYRGVVQLGSSPDGASAPGAPANSAGIGTINAGDDGVASISGAQGGYGGLGRYGTMTFEELHIGTGGTTMFDVSQAGVPGGANNDLVATTGTLEVGGGTLVMNFNGGAVSGTTYRLFNAGNLTGAAGFTNSIFNARIAGGGPMTAANVNSVTGANGTVELVVTQSSISNTLQWQPRNTSAFNPAASFYVANTWDTAVSNNWKNNTIGALTADFFYPTDTVTFNDVLQSVTSPSSQTLVDGTVVLTAPVFPAAVVVNPGSGAGYTFAGTTFSGRTQPPAGKISGTASLTKNGGGSLVILTDNEYTGGTTINSGTVQLGTNPPTGNLTAALLNENTLGSLGTGSVTMAGSTTLIFSRKDVQIVTNDITGGGTVVKTNVGHIRLDGNNSYTGGTIVRVGVIRLGHDNAIPGGTDLTLVTSPNPITTTSNVGGWLNLFGFNESLRSLVSLNGTLSLVQNTGSVFSTLTIGTANYSGAIGTSTQGFSGSINLVKATTGMATLSHNNSTYVGTTQINDGTLLVVVGPGTGVHTGNANSTYFVSSGAALGGNGTITAPISIAAGGILTPGIVGGGSLEVGTLGLGTLALTSSALRWDLNVGAMDQVVINNTNGLNTNGFTSLTGVSTFNINNITGGGTVNAGTYTLINYSGVPLPGLSSFALTTNIGSTYTLTLLNNTANTSIDVSIIRTGPPNNGEWNVDSGGSWTAPANWLTNPNTGDIPNAVNSIATFGIKITAPRSVSVDAIKALGTMVFNNANSYNLTGGPTTTITFDTSSISVGTAGITVMAGSHTIGAPIVSLDNLVVDVAGSSRLAITSNLNVADTTAGRQMTKTGGGTLQVEHVRNTFGNDGTATMSVNGGRLVISQKLAGNNDPNGTSNVNALSIAGGAVLDLTNNSMVIDYNAGAGLGSLLTDLKSMLNDGRLVTTASSPLVGRDVRLGYKDNANSTGAGNATVLGFAGQAIDASTVLIKFTYGGDTNLDGRVDISDLLNLAQHYNGAGDWQFGDFTRDGLVNQADLTILAQDWQAGVGGGQLGGSLSSLLGGMGLPGDVGVPEPTTIGLGAMGMGLMLSRRRRRNGRSS